MDRTLAAAAKNSADRKCAERLSRELLRVKKNWLLPLSSI